MMVAPSVGAFHDSETLPSKGSAIETVSPVGGNTGRENTLTEVSEAVLAPMALRATTR